MNTNVILDDDIADGGIADTTTTPTPLTSRNAILRQYELLHRRISRANEKILKGYYVDWLFSRLNLTKHS